MAAPSSALSWLEPILTRRRPDGTFYYSNQDVAALIPVLLLNFGVDPRTLPTALKTVVAQFAQDAGVTEGMSKQEAQACMQAHLQARPLNPELVFEVRRGMREERHESAGDGSRELTRVLGVVVTSSRPSLAGPPPEGTARGGQLARIFLDQVPSKKRAPEPKRSKRGARATG